jgi:hypothetical protein
VEGGFEPIVEGNAVEGAGIDAAEARKKGADLELGADAKESRREEGTRVRGEDVKLPGTEGAVGNGDTPGVSNSEFIEDGLGWPTTVERVRAHIETETVRFFGGRHAARLSGAFVKGYAHAGAGEIGRGSEAGKCRLQR